MQRRSIVLSCLLACALAGCGGTDTGAIGPIGDSLVPVPAETAAPAPAPEVNTVEPPTTEAAAVVVPAMAVPATKAPPATSAPTTAAPRPVVAPTVAPPPVLPAAAAGGCDPSYPGVCIPPGPPDLDCADVPHRRFTVIGADPHRFDADGDAIGCEMP